MPFLGARGQASRGYFGGGTTPDAPTSLVATRGNTEISVAFSAPAFNGGLNITNYEYSLNAGSTWTALSPVDAASPVLITGLSNGTTYTVYLRAVNALGSGTTSAPANAVTPAAVPGAPGTPTATTCQNTQSALSWTAAASNGSAITDYVVEYSTSATFASAVTVFADGTSASTSATVTGLANGTPYYFRVKATNAVGTGTYSGISTVITPATVPGAPTSVVGTACANAQSSVSWVAPASKGGDAVASYTVEYSTSATFASAVTVVSPTSTSSPKVVTGLTNGTTYYFRVKANNCAGSSSYSTISAGVTPATVPNAPTSVVGTSNTNGQSSVSWVAPSNGGDAVDYYTVQYSTSATFASAVTTVSPTSVSSPKIVDGLSNGTTYYFRVKATNCAGDSSYSATASATPSTVPGTPTNVQGTANGVTSSTVTWTAPAAANTGPNFTDITGYKVEYAVSPYSSYTEFTANTGSTATSISVTGLTNGGSYKFKVTARNVPNDLGTTSAESAVVVTNIVPGAPTIGTMTRGTATSTTDSLAWTAPTANGGSAITEYVYALSTDSYATATATGSTSVSRTFNPGYTATNTTVKIAAKNSLGTGPYSAASAVGYGGWALGAAADNTASCSSVSCTCAACDCGTSTGTNSTQTQTRDCYTWTRSGNSDSTIYNSNGTTACTSAYSACSGGTCASCTGCASYTSAAKTGNFSQGGIDYTYTGTAGSYYAFPNPTCSNGCDFSSAYYTVTVCNGTNTITLTSSDACLNAEAEPC